MFNFKKTTLRSIAAALAVGTMSVSALAESIVSFNGPAGEAYIGKFIKGIKATAKLKGYEISVYENQFNQAEQDQQVQQVLAAGQLPDIFIWWPSDAVAGLGSLRSLHRTGVPVLKINQLPNEQDKKYIFGFAGPDDALRASNAGLMMVEAAKARKAAGAKRFNVVAVTYPQSYGGYSLSMNAFKKAISGSDLKLIGEVDEGFGQSNGYKGAAKTIAKLKAQGIDYVYGMDYKMGTDVVAVGTVCNGDRQLLEEGKQYGTTLQSPLHEGQLAIKMVEEYLSTGKLKNYLNFTPNPQVTKANMDTLTLKGYDGKVYGINELCSGAWAK